VEESFPPFPKLPKFKNANVLSEESGGNNQNTSNTSKTQRNASSLRFGRGRRSCRRGSSTPRSRGRRPTPRTSRRGGTPTHLGCPSRGRRSSRTRGSRRRSPINPETIGQLFRKRNRGTVFGIQIQASDALPTSLTPTLAGEWGVGGTAGA
jgi:hypothetical protein